MELDFSVQISDEQYFRLKDDGEVLTLSIGYYDAVVKDVASLDALQSALYIFRNNLEQRIEKQKKDLENAPVLAPVDLIPKEMDVKF